MYKFGLFIYIVNTRRTCPSVQGQFQLIYIQNRKKRKNPFIHFYLLSPKNRHKKFFAINLLQGKCIVPLQKNSFICFHLRFRAFRRRCRERVEAKVSCMKNLFKSRPSWPFVLLISFYYFPLPLSLIALLYYIHYIQRFDQIFHFLRVIFCLNFNDSCPFS